MSVNFPASAPRHQSHTLAELVDGIGTAEFGARLVGFLHGVCGADHCAMFQLGAESISAPAFGSFDPSRPAVAMVHRYVREGFWRKDPALSIARSRLSRFSASVIRLDLDDARYADLRPRIYPQVRDRVLLCGRRDHVDFGLSVVRSEPNQAFDSATLEHLAQLSDTLLAAMAKHIRVLMQTSDLAMALADVDRVENCLHVCSELPRRELEVCSRILCGLSTAGIALDLGIGEESVKTYRKRTYLRLAIATERELLRWYLARWSTWRRHLQAPPREALH